MNILKLSIYKLLSYPLNSLLSLLLFAIGTAIISLMMQVDRHIDSSFKRNTGNIDLVVGAKGSPLQLILSSVFHSDSPTGNISLDEARIIIENPMVSHAIPIALGDNFEGYRIVGTELTYAELYDAKLADGNWYSHSMEAVIGAQVAKNTGLNTGDAFTGIHGFTEHGHGHDNFPYSVTGIMAPTGTVIDRLILTPVESVWKVHGHSGSQHSCDHDDHTDCDHSHSAHSHHSESHHPTTAISEILEKVNRFDDLTAEELRLYNEHQGHLQQAIPDPGNEITALLLFYQSPMAAVQLPGMINQNTKLQAASPALEFNRLVNNIGTGMDALKAIAWVIIIISGLNIFILLLNVLNQNIHEIALMRALGGSPSKVMLLLTSQGAVLASAGWLIGIIIARMVWTFLPESFTFTTTFLHWVCIDELMLLSLCLILGVLASMFPALKAYRTNVHYILSR